jgi:hypothetical protein
MVKVKVFCKNKQTEARNITNVRTNFSPFESFLKSSKTPVISGSNTIALVYVSYIPAGQSALQFDMVTGVFAKMKDNGSRYLTVKNSKSFLKQDTHLLFAKARRISNAAPFLFMIDQRVVASLGWKSIVEKLPFAVGSDDQSITFYKYEWKNMPSGQIHRIRIPSLVLKDLLGPGQPTEKRDRPVSNTRVAAKTAKKGKPTLGDMYPIFQKHKIFSGWVGNSRIMFVPREVMNSSSNLKTLRDTFKNVKVLPYTSRGGTYLIVQIGKQVRVLVTSEVDAQSPPMLVDQLM